MWSSDVATLHHASSQFWDSGFEDSGFSPVSRFRASGFGLQEGFRSPAEVFVTRASGASILASASLGRSKSFVVKEDL